MDTVAERDNRTRTIRRVLSAVRARKLPDQTRDYVYHESFDDPALEGTILGPMPGLAEYEAARARMRGPGDGPPELACLYAVPLLNQEQERHLFRKMNFLKHKANQLRRKVRTPAGKIDPAPPRARDLRLAEELTGQAALIKGHLIHCNMRLVVSVAKRYASPSDNLFELVSEGNLTLIRAVEKFDFSRGFKFSTYATGAIMKDYGRSIPKEKQRRERYPTGHELVFESALDTHQGEHEYLAHARQATQTVSRLLEHLDPRERQVVRMRAGLDYDSGGMTLKDIGGRLGVTKERARQLNARAMKKLRGLAQGRKDKS